MNKRHWFYIGIFCGAVFGFMAGAMAEEHDASATMRIGARIIQCGTRYEALGQCKAGVMACCPFAPAEYVAPEVMNAIEPSGYKYPDIDMHGVAVEVEETDEGFTVNFE
jgi:hypothetical protein